MKRKVFLFLAAAAMIAASCLREEMPQPQEEGVYFTFEAAREALSEPSAPAPQSSASKTVLLEGNKVEWVKNDLVGVYNGINGIDGSAVSAVDSDGATFKAEVAAGQWIKSWQFAAKDAGAKSVFTILNSNFDATKDDYLLLYPRSWNYFGKMGGETKMIRFWLGKTQKATLDTFDPAAGFAIAKTTSLETTPENPIVFKNVMSLLKFTVPAELAGEITKITVWGKNSEHLGGELICDYSGDEPVMLPFKKVYSESSKGYTDVSIEDTKGMASGYYYLAVCPGEVKGFVVQVTSKSGRIYRRETTNTITLKSGVIYDMGEIEAETYGNKGITELPYVFSLDEKSKDTPTYLRKSVGSYTQTGKYRDLFLYDDAVGAVLQARQIGESGQVQGYAYWSNTYGAYNMPAKSMVSKEIAGEGYEESCFKLTVPLKMTLPESFNVTIGFAMWSGAVKNWKLQYSNDDKTWYDAGSFKVYECGEKYHRCNVTVTPQITFGDMLYLKWLPVGTETWNSASAWGVNVRLWGAVVITDLAPKQTTPAPAGAIFFEGFDEMTGGVDYIMNGQENAQIKLGGISDYYGKLIGSNGDGRWPNNKKPEQWHGLTCAVVAMRPGYAQIGHIQAHCPMAIWGYLCNNASVNIIGSITTPKLAEGNLKVSFKAMMFRNPLIGRSGLTLLDTYVADKIVVNVLGSGTFADGTTSKKIADVPYTAFQEYELEVKGATADTQIQFTSPTDEVLCVDPKNGTSIPVTRWFIDDICVMKDGADTDVARTIQVANPDLKIFLPKPSKANGKLVILVPGGGYSGMNLAGDREGDGWASYYNERGFASATLRYTLPNGNCLLPVNDLKNAIKYIRDHAEELGVSEIGVHGFSAGGHLASTGATHFTGELRPDFQIMFYPVITLKNATHNGSRNKFLGSNPSRYMLDLYSNELQVTPQTPKAFVMYYVPDTVVPQATNGAAYVEALKANNVPVKTLIYETCYPDSDTQTGHGWWERDTRIDGKHVKEHLADWLKTL